MKELIKFYSVTLVPTFEFEITQLDFLVDFKV